MLLILRDYQATPVEALTAGKLMGEHAVVSLPMGAGKSVVVAGLVDHLSMHGDERIVVTVPSCEVVEQNERALRVVLASDQVGVVPSSPSCGTGCTRCRKPWERQLPNLAFSYMAIPLTSKRAH